MHLFFDGLTANAHNVHVHADANGLAILDVEGKMLALWPLAQIELIDGLRLKCRHDETARLHLEDEAALRALGMDFGKREKGRSLKLAIGSTFGFVLIASLVFLFSSRCDRTALMLTPSHIDTALGGCVAALVKKNKRRVTDASALRALEKIQKRLKSHAKSDFDFDVTILCDGENNAFALPGGFIFVQSGLLEHVQSPEALAGVLAHEMGHVVERHGMVSLLKSLGMGAALGQLSRLGDLASDLWMASHSQSQETEADSFAAHLLGKAQISTQGLKAYFEEMNKEQPNTIWESYLSSHPNSALRAEALQDPVGFKPRAKLLSKSEWKALQAACVP